MPSDHCREKIFIDFREKAERKKDEEMKKIGGMEEITGKKRSFGESDRQWNVSCVKFPSFSAFFPLSLP